MSEIISVKQEYVTTSLTDNTLIKGYYRVEWSDGKVSSVNPSGEGHYNDLVTQWVANGGTIVDNGA
jgi:hypothetical protein|tara:strand:- start:836 stop:1033 length:198 start_codon:yes stop_codon:yes gene_type:complete